MYEYYFLFALAFVWLCFAVVQDIRTREISNWLNFSLLSFALLYRAYVALVTDNSGFFWWGIISTIFFVFLAYILYYGRAFAGGDAKLLMALGPVIPFERLSDALVLGFGFIAALFLLGSIYSLLYTLVLVPQQWKAFKKSFVVQIRDIRSLTFICLLLGVVMGVAFAFIDLVIGLSMFIALALLPLLYSYGKTVERVFFIKTVSAARLTEGDWLVRGVRVGKLFIKPSVQGLTLKDIALLRKAGKSVVIKEGIPFSPAFLLAFLAMVFFFLG